MNLQMHRDDSDDDESDEEEELVDFCPSWIGQIFQIQYFIKVYVKHDAMFETGAGNYCNFPIKIVALPNLEPSSE